MYKNKPLFLFLNLFLSASLFCASAAVSSAGAPGLGAASGSGRPSVEDVFSGLAPQEIAEQVQMAQQLIEDLHAKGSQEEIQAFYQMLEETLNSMSPQDVEDIKNIAKLVEPLITVPEQSMPFMPPADSSSAVSSSTTDTTSSVSQDAVEMFKNMISSIIEHIDSIFQKIHSSKDCSELVDNKWENKTTFQNMKRQIAQLKHDRLARKLTSSTMSDDEKNLVKNLEKFKDTVKKYDSVIKISDDFGLNAKNTEKQEIKDVKAFLDTANETIDTLMPSIEKFLQKYDPEALQMSKEAEAFSKKAGKDALEATVRKPSADAKPQSTSAGYKPYTTPQNYYGNDYGFAPEYYDENYGLGSPHDQPLPDSSGSSKSSGQAGKTSDAKTTENKEKKLDDKEKKSTDATNRIKSDIAGFIQDDYPKSHETDFISFINTLENQYPAHTIDMSNPADERAWIDSTHAYTTTGLKQYADEKLDTFSTKFSSEFSSLSKVLTDARSDIHKLADEQLKDLQNNKDLTAIANRLNSYKSAFTTTLQKIDAKFAKNATQQPKNPDPAADSVAYYHQQHNKFIKKLEKEIGNKISDLEDDVKSFKGRISRALKNKKQA